MIENNEVKITTSEAMEVLRIIKKLGLKEDISNAIEILTALNNRKESKFTELRRLIIKEVGLEEYKNLTEDEKKEMTEKIFIENEDFKEEFEKVNIECNREMSKLGTNILYDFITALPNSEKEVYKCLAKIYGKTAKEIESQELDETIEQIKKIAQSKTVMVFFNLATK
jgi:hypothetical protein|nr:MAG TPA: hypothetical protein [Caudoviricetes sp.]